MSPMGPSAETAIQNVAADGVRITRPGTLPAPGGIKGSPALRADGSKGCCRCGLPLPADRGRSPYCADCKQAAARQAARRRDTRQTDATQAQRALLSAEHWRGPGFLYGRDGTLILDPATVRALRDAFGGALSGLTEHGPLAERPYDPRNGQHYHRVLGEVLEHIENLNMILRLPLWPRSSGYQAPGPVVEEQTDQ